MLLATAGCTVASMDRRDLAIRIGAVTAVVASAAATIWARTARRRRLALGPDGVVESGDRPRSGTVRDRGKGGYAIDVERLRDASDGIEPAVEYLTYIQTRRGTSEHLLFVRDDDIDAIAALEGEEPTDFLERLQKLGVVISTN